MNRRTLLLGIALVSLTAGGCADDEYRYGLGLGWVSHPYQVWYDGHYGQFYDGYWGTDDFFYFRLNVADRHYRRGDEGHFRRERVWTDARYRSYRGNTKEPARGTHMPNYPGERDRDVRR